MRIPGMVNMYSFLNTSAAQRYSALRSASTSKTQSAGKAYGSNYAYGTGSTYAARAAEKVQAIYEDTKNAASNVRTYSQNLMNGDKSGLLARAEASGSTKEVVSEVKSFVEEYNNMLRNMKNTGGTMNDLYAGQLKTSLSNYKEDLAAVGISAGRDGSLVLNEEALGKADISALKKAFGSTDSFVGKASVKSIYVEANAVSQQTKAQYSYGNYGSYGGYGSYSPYSSLYNYGNYSSLGSALGLGYGSGYSNYGSMIGTLFNSLF